MSVYTVEVRCTITDQAERAIRLRRLFSLITKESSTAPAAKQNTVEDSAEAPESETTLEV